VANALLTWRGRPRARVDGAVIATGALVLASIPRLASAHGFGQRYDLPVPLWMWLTAGAAAVICSFVVVSLFMTGAKRGGGYPRINLLEWRGVRALIHSGAPVILKIIFVGLLLLIIVAGLAGNQRPTRNLAPTAVWVLWWVGFAYISALVGDLWMLVNPWNTLFSWFERVLYRGGSDARHGGLSYPSWLGNWPAVVLFLAFAWTELVFIGRAVPASLAVAILGYSVVTWLGMLAFGRAAWLRYGDPFAVAFRLLSLFAPTEVRVTDPELCRRCPVRCTGRDGACVNCYECFARAPASRRELNLRPFAAGLIGAERTSASMAVFVALVLSTVTFDGFTGTPAWSRLENTLYGALPFLGTVRLAVIGTMGLIAFPVVFWGLYRGFAEWVARAGGSADSTGDVARAFVVSLVPIAIAYHLAHYFTYLLIQGQLLIPLASDPLGLGWNLLGTARYRPDIGIVGARFAWYTAVIAIVVGHIIAVYVAHAIALRVFPDRVAAVHSQYPMLLLMVGYTMISLWIIAQPIVETSPKG
jgi:polyferredoxin